MARRLTKIIRYIVPGGLRPRLEEPHPSGVIKWVSEESPRRGLVPPAGGENPRNREKKKIEKPRRGGVISYQTSAR